MKLIYGDEKYFIDYYSKRALMQAQDIFDKVTYDETADLDEIITSLTSFSLFDEARLVIINNSPLLYDVKKNLSQINELTEVLKNLPSGVDVIFSLYDPKIKFLKPSKLFDFLIKNADVKKCSKVADRDLGKFIKKYVSLNKATIDEEATNDLVSRFPNNLFLITNELDKYILSDNHITLENIKSDDISISDNAEWAFSDALLKNYSYKKMYQKYLEQVNIGTPVALLVSQIANILNIALQIHILKTQHQNYKQISIILGIHEYRIKLISGYLEIQGIKKILENIKNLSQMDIDVKNGYLDEQTAMNYFVLKLLK